jgi:hypothetical protein
MPGDSRGGGGVWGVRWQRGEETTFAIMRVVSYRRCFVVVRGRGGSSGDRLNQWAATQLGASGVKLRAVHTLCSRVQDDGTRTVSLCR